MRNKFINNSFYVELELRISKEAIKLIRLRSASTILLFIVGAAAVGYLFTLGTHSLNAALEATLIGAVIVVGSAYNYLNIRVAKAICKYLGVSAPLRSVPAIISIEQLDTWLDKVKIQKGPSA